MLPSMYIFIYTYAYKNMAVNPRFKTTVFETTRPQADMENQCVDIWQFPLKTEFSTASMFLDKEELARARRLHFPKHQRRFIVGRAMLRLILARYLDLKPTDLVFNYNKHGKPDVKNDQRLHFNLSHSKELALLAISRDYPVGVDIEFLSARPYEGIGAHIFSEQEHAYLANMPDTLKPLVFFHMWAQKEALIKACGIGLTYPTKQFDVNGLPPASQYLIDPQYTQEWILKSFMPVIACCAAVCYHPSVKTLRYIKLDEASDSF